VAGKVKRSTRSVALEDERENRVREATTRWTERMTVTAGMDEDE
jgi:hypothetical protein